MRHFQIRTFALLVLLSSIVISCNEPGDVGIELLPGTDLVNVGNAIEQGSITAFTLLDDSVRSDEAATNLIGSLSDPVFGKTSADVALQFRLSNFPSFKSFSIADSAILYLYYRYIYGDTSTVQKIRIYELDQSIDRDAAYFSDVDLSKLAKTRLLAEHSFKPKVALDSIYRDTLYQLLTIKLDQSFANKLISADSLDLVNNERFLQYFKGLYIQSQDVQEGGAIVSLDLLATSSFQGSALTLYYRNSFSDTASTRQAFFVNNFSARVNSFKHDYSQTVFYNQLNKETVEDSLIYIQSTGGLLSKLYIPGIEGWKDSSDLYINKAELVFLADTLASDYRRFRLPDQLVLTYLDGSGRKVYPADLSFYPLYYGGFRRSDNTYRFNITQHVKQIIKGEIENKGFFLSTANKNSEMRRAVLKGSSSAHGIKLIVTYSKVR